MKKIIVVGSACSGKTTLIAALKQLYPQFSTPTETIRTLFELAGENLLL